MMLEWKHSEDGNSTFIQLPIKIKKSVNDSYGIGGNLICNKCATKLEQRYKCPCGEETTVGKVERRKDKKNGIVYFEKDKKMFMETKTNDSMRVLQEITPSDVMEEIEYAETPFEVYNNETDKAQDTIRKIHSFLRQKKIVLLVEFGYNGDEQGGFVIPTKNKLLLFGLRDYNLIKEPTQIGLQIKENALDEVLMATTESKKPKLYAEFLNAVENKVKIVPKIAEEQKQTVEEIDFLKGF